MKVIDFADMILNNSPIRLELYSVELEKTVWSGVYDGFQPRDIIPEKFWNELVDTFQFDKDFICINF